MDQWQKHNADLMRLIEKRGRAWRRFNSRTTKLAALADPATGGNECLAHNWGSQQASDIWARGWARWRCYNRAFEALAKTLFDAMRDCPR